MPRTNCPGCGNFVGNDVHGPGGLNCPDCGKLTADDLRRQGFEFDWQTRVWDR